MPSMPCRELPFKYNWRLLDSEEPLAYEQPAPQVSEELGPKPISQTLTKLVLVVFSNMAA
eukprot:6459348-Amphidinium_carterae.1